MDPVKRRGHVRLYMRHELRLQIALERTNVLAHCHVRAAAFPLAPCKRRARDALDLLEPTLCAFNQITMAVTAGTTAGMLVTQCIELGEQSRAIDGRQRAVQDMQNLLNLQPVVPAPPCGSL